MPVHQEPESLPGTVEHPLAPRRAQSPSHESSRVRSAQSARSYEGSEH